MNTFTLENIKVDKNVDYLYDLFTQTVVDKPFITNPRYTAYVQEGEEMRIDRVCERLYGSEKYVEELMLINNILNPFSISVGDPILYVSLKNITNFDQLETPEKSSDKVANPQSNKNTRVDPNRDKGVIPTIKPVDLQPVILDKVNQTITVNGKIS